MTPLLRSLVKCAVALCVLSAAAFAQPKPKAAVYIMGNPEGRDAIRSAVNTSLIKSGKYQMIAVDAIDLVAQEQKRQMSGSVSDGDIAALGRDAGAEYVCVVQRSELDGTSYVATRMVSVRSKVAEFADMVELPPGGKIIDIIQWQIGSMLGMPVGPRPAAPAASGYSAVQSSQYSAQTTAASNKTEPPIQGIAVPGNSLAQKLTWLQKSADSHNTYIVDVNADERIAPQILEYKDAVNITVVLRGVGGNRTIRLSSNGTMFDVRENVTLVLDNNITLKGHSGNKGSYYNWCADAMVCIRRGGTLKMNNGAAIVDNPMGGVSISGGAFEMTGGTISGNSAPKFGGGVCIDPHNTFNMTGGAISGNKASYGGGVYVSPHGATFNMRGGVISGNTATEEAGGVSYSCSFTSTFTKTGGTITGYNSDPVNGNTVKDEDGNVLARKGHAIYCDGSTSKRKETTAGPKDNFSKDGSGAWD